MEAGQALQLALPGELEKVLLAQEVQPVDPLPLHLPAGQFWHWLARVRNEAAAKVPLGQGVGA